MTASFVDRQAITDVLLAYCTSIDSFDFDGLAVLLTDDVVVSYHGHEPLVGVTDVVSFVAGYCQGMAWQQHVPTVMSVQVDGDTAHTLSYFTAHSVRGADPSRLTVTMGEYVDTLARTADGWRLARRTLNTGWRETRTRS